MPGARLGKLFHIHVDYDIDEGFVSQLRDAKKSFRERMEDQAEEWRQKPQSFDEDVETHYTSWRTTLLKTRILIVDWLVQWVMALDEKEENPVRVVDQFFLSEVPEPKSGCRYFRNSESRAMSK